MLAACLINIKDGFVWGIPHLIQTRNAASTEAYVVSGGSRVLGSASDIYLKAGNWPKIAKVDSLQELWFMDVYGRFT